MLLVPTPEVFHYIMFRLEKAGIQSDLDDKYFKQEMQDGCRRFFGAIVDEAGDVLSDPKYPRWLEEFKNSR